MTSSPSASSTPPPPPPPRPSRNEVPAKDRGPRAKAQSSPARDLALVVAFTALMVVLGIIPAIPIPVGPAGIIFQNFAILLAGLVLGWKRAALSVGLLLLMGLFLPVLSGKGGVQLWTLPFGGYYIGFITSVVIMGFIVKAFGAERRTVGFIVATTVGVIFTLLCGTLIGYSLIFGYSVRDAFIAGFFPFLPGDALKGALAVLVARQVVKAYPQMLA